MNNFKIALFAAIALASPNFANAEETYTDVAVISTSAGMVACGVAGITSLASTRRGDPRRISQAVSQCGLGAALTTGSLAVGGVTSVATQDLPDQKQMDQPVAEQDEE